VAVAVAVAVAVEAAVPEEGAGAADNRHRPRTMQAFHRFLGRCVFLAPSCLLENL